MCSLELCGVLSQMMLLAAGFFFSLFFARVYFWKELLAAIVPNRDTKFSASLFTTAKIVQKYRLYHLWNSNRSEVWGLYMQSFMKDMLYGHVLQKDARRTRNHSQLYEMQTPTDWPASLQSHLQLRTSWADRTASVETGHVEECLCNSTHWPQKQPTSVFEHGCVHICRRLRSYPPKSGSSQFWTWAWCLGSDVHTDLMNQILVSTMLGIWVRAPNVKQPFYF